MLTSEGNWEQVAHAWKKICIILKIISHVRQMSILKNALKSPISLHTCAPNSEIPSNIGSMNPSIRHDAAPSRVSNHPSTDNNLLLCACCAIYGSDLSRDNDTRESPPPPGSNPGETTRQPYWYPWHQYTHMALVLDGNSEKGAHVYNAIGNFICWMHLSQQ